ncbi:MULTISPECIES: hypothetical protein [Rhizobium]|nr:MULTISPECIES: hypothetical protein [Rhizobium]KWV49009.1 hypothetical protein AS026_11550 [Rhizobium altiplani]KWV49119.1 hypothetical protein AS026_11175 [Rhizobium altiplani]KWV58888.1 hypothetical protein AS026_29910 [Rhizobium altiplani]
MANSERQLGELARMEAARRKTQHQLDLIDRLTALIPLLGRRLPRTLPHQSGSLTAERQPEVDALTRNLARQDATIAAL